MLFRTFDTLFFAFIGGILEHMFYSVHPNGSLNSFLEEIGIRLPQ